MSQEKYTYGFCLQAEDGEVIPYGLIKDAPHLPRVGETIAYHGKSSPILPLAPSEEGPRRFFEVTKVVHIYDEEPIGPAATGAHRFNNPEYGTLVVAKPIEVSGTLEKLVGYNDHLARQKQWPRKHKETQ